MKRLYHSILGCVIIGLLLVVPVLGFPPAPDHVILGMVRDEFGQPIELENVSVVLMPDSGGALRTSLVPELSPGVNYRLTVPVDSGATLDPYKASALQPRVPFQISVVIAGISYLPIEMQGNLWALGEPAGETRLDLTLGEDLDGDGLPDAWERALLAGGQVLSDILPGDDADNDGMSNLDEYLAGTYAFDPSDGFRLEIAGMIDGWTQLEFTAIRGRTYSVERSPDLDTWESVEFRVSGEEGEGRLRSHFRAIDVRQVHIEVDSPTEPGLRDFFRLVVE